MDTRNNHRHNLNLLKKVSTQSTCARRDVACMLTDKNGKMLSVACNGVPKGILNCKEYPCGGTDCGSTEGLHLCLAVHAEQNALMACTDISNIHTCYTSVSPCIHCMKMLMNTNCKLLVFDEVYDSNALDLWMSSGHDRNYRYVGEL